MIVPQDRLGVCIVAKIGFLPLNPCYWFVGPLHAIEESVKLFVPATTITWSAVRWAPGILHAA